MATSTRENKRFRNLYAQNSVLTTHKKILIGGLGALTPILLNLLALDLKTTFATTTLLVVAGYTVRVMILFYVGGLVAYLHKDEHKPIKLFELGIAAPALLTTIISAAQVAPQATAASQPERSGDQRALISFVMPVAYADSLEDRKTRRFTLPEESATAQVWRGLTGARINRVWFVIADSFPELGDAERAADRINQRQTDLKAEVFEPYDGSQGYSVVIGANLTFDDATALKDKAANAGIKATLWTFPRK
ncbi:MAG TPA: hypothetical protein VFV34_12625 [Blastocatellia bacterium]|nr:hypothetical protein [Blastocatellia bacterium]